MYHLCYQCAKNYQSWWKFDKVMAKTILHSFFETRCRLQHSICTTRAATTPRPANEQSVTGLQGGRPHTDWMISAQIQTSIHSNHPIIYRTGIYYVAVRPTTATILLLLSSSSSSSSSFDCPITA